MMNNREMLKLISSFFSPFWKSSRDQAQTLPSLCNKYSLFFQIENILFLGSVSLYFSMVLFLSLFPSVPVASLLLFFIIFYLLLTAACRFLPDPIISMYQQQKYILFYSGIAALMSLLIQGGMFLCCFGGFTPDTVSQWNQAMTGDFFDWAPAIHTFLLWCAAKIWSNYSFVVALQILCFAVTMGYLARTLLYADLPAWIVLLIILFIQINPQTLLFLQHPLKDCAFSMAILVCACHELQICTTDGKWLKSRKNIITFSCFLSLATLLRHNGLFYTVPCILLIGLCYFTRFRKSVCWIIIIFVVLIFIIRGPFYSFAKVRPATRYPKVHIFVEACALPFGIMAEIWLKYPNKVPPETDEFLKTIVPRDVWEQRFDHFSFDSVKWLSKNLERDIKCMSIYDFTSMFIRTVQVDPNAACIYFIRNTGLAWRPVIRDVNERFAPVFSEPVRKTDALKLIQQHYFNRTLFGRSIWYSLFWCIGFWLIPFYALAVVRFIHDGHRILILVLPVASYNFGTSLMMTSYDDVRYFYFNTLILIPLMMFLLTGLKNKNPYSTENKQNNGTTK